MSSKQQSQKKDQKESDKPNYMDFAVAKFCPVCQKLTSQSPQNVKKKIISCSFCGIDYRVEKLN